MKDQRDETQYLHIEIYEDTWGFLWGYEWYISEPQRQRNEQETLLQHSIIHTSKFIVMWGHIHP
jgi:hypothetical protein